ncbi:hypothetical protein Gotri_022072 [Gossypium trilobum]|uniref:Serine carboxypeptidase-like 44 n=1 Tax=Gossypium trilobum TaxID=34281 RepID=A0A7J9DEF5_9ROSI|nr:hypothetical protein [Gossypium trilobum]
MGIGAFFNSLYAFLFGGILGYHLYDQITLPGQPEIEFRQFSGYIDIDPDAGRSLFYYFVEAEKDPLDLPLTIWLTGGPGCSSVGDSFVGIGPFTTTNNAHALKINPYAWNKGHFVTLLANSLLHFNNETKSTRFNLKGLALGSPVLRYKLDVIAQYELYASKGMISHKMYHKILKQCNEADEDNYSNDSPEWSESCEHVMNKALMTAFNVSSVREANKMRFDIVRNPCDGRFEDLIAGKEVTMVVGGIDMCIPNRVDFYLGMPEVQQAFHGNRTHLGYKYSGCFQNSGLNYSIADQHVDMLPILKEILEHSVPITIFSGEDDGAVPMIGTLRHVKKLASEMDFTLTKDEAWNHENKEGGRLYKFGDLLTFMSVKGANHHAPLSKPSQSLYIFQNHVVEQSD